MNASIRVNYDDFAVICRSDESDLDRAEALNSAARQLAAIVAAGESLPHYTLDCKIGEQFEYRENISAFVPSISE